jgi:hypothetical protein
MMDTFIMLKRSEETLALATNDPNAFTLLSLIALRARRTNIYNKHNLKIGEALIGDYATLGMKRGQYREATKRLTKHGFITIKTTNKGTITTIVDTRVYDINIDDDNHQPNHQATIQQPSNNHPTTTNKNVKKENNANNEKEVEGFQEFWEAYPKKKSKQSAINWWKKNKPSQELQLRIHSTLYALKGSPEWLKDKGQFIPYPASWLNTGGWDDDVGVKHTPTVRTCKYCNKPAVAAYGRNWHCGGTECRAKAKE